VRDNRRASAEPNSILVFYLYGNSNADAESHSLELGVR
jgi:hypothetical protein